ncbi:AAA family ATPase, subfamily protein, partial [mine drainage metagenome]
MTRAIKRSANNTATDVSDVEKSIPIVLYSLKDGIVRLVQRPTFLDAVFLLFTFIAIVAALPFYPLVLVVILAALLFAAALYHPFLGLITLMILMFTVLLYQVPLFAWIFLFIMSLSLIFGYMHYKTITFIYMLIALSFSFLGYLFAIPAFIVGVLQVGYKRAIVMAVCFVLGVVMISAMTGVQNTSYIVYNAAIAHSQINATSVYSYTVVSKPALSLFNFGAGFGKALNVASSTRVIDGISTMLFAEMYSFIISPFGYLLEIVALVGIVMAIDNFAASSRSQYKGAEASIIGMAYPAAAVGLSFLFHYTISSYVVVIVSAAIAPILLYGIEFYNLDIVKSLAMRKQDTRMKFGEAFEDLQVGNTNETFDDIGNYENTKKELKEAVLSPIEQRGISRAYNIKPVKGILFFGPPGTGKTMMMRALSNEIHANFYYVKTPDLISAFSGETEKMVSKIFTTARKHQPCVLFFDEIDTLATNRDDPNVDQIRRQALTQLLVEMDGFQKTDRIIAVGATNVPNMLDPAILRPGRFDKIIYMPLPDFLGRQKVFKMYLDRLPVADDIKYEELASNTERYSGADIKAVCDSVAQVVAQEASSKHKVLRITQNDILGIISATKPSTTLSQIEEYNTFRVQFERSFYEESSVEKEDNAVKLNDVIGMDEAKSSLVNAIQTPLMHPDLMKKYDIKAIRGLLLFGPPGTGKTMLMRAAMNDQSLKGATMIEINGAEIANMGLEKGNATIKDIFDRARENEPAIIFIDEIDGIAPSRSGATENASQITTELLKQMDGLTKPYGVVVVAATNRPDSLDTAILRPGRFDKIIFVKPPTSQQRALIFREYFKNVPLDDNIDFDKLA